MEMSIAKHAPMLMSAKVRKPAICPLMRLSIPIDAPSSNASKSLKIEPQTVTSGLMISFQICSIIFSLFSI